MIATLEGKVAQKGVDFLVLNVGGVGFFVSATAAALQAAKVGEGLFLFTKLIVREDAFELFGFADREERAMFEKLTAVSGIGPRTALQVLSALGVHDLALAVVTGDAKAIRKAPGIGVKTAQRLLLELRDKVSNEELVGEGFAAQAGGAPSPGPVADAIEALCALGYAQAEAAQAVAQVKDQAQDSAGLTRLALRALSRLR